MCGPTSLISKRFLPQVLSSILSEVSVSIAWGAILALNFLVRKILFENDWIVAFPLHPGTVQTDMGSGAARVLWMEEAPMTVDGSVKALLVRIDEATRENLSGKMITFEGNHIDW
jgi:norsolorinic acid ketoreductase